MIAIRDLLHDDLIIEEIEATDKMGVIREFCRLLKSTGRIENEDKLVRVLLDRESLGSTGIGDGVAIPHAKLQSLPNMLVAFGRSSKGIDFQSLDAKPVHLFFLLVAPDNKLGDHLKTLSRISRILKNPVLRGELRQASHRQEIKRLISKEDNNYSQPQVVQRT